MDVMDRNGPSSTVYSLLLGTLLQLPTPFWFHFILFCGFGENLAFLSSQNKLLVDNFNHWKDRRTKGCNGGENATNVNTQAGFISKQLLNKSSLKVPVPQVLKTIEIASNPEQPGRSSSICSEVV